MKKQTTENKLEQKLLKSIENKEFLKDIDKNYREYTDYILSLDRYKFHPLPLAFSKATDKYIRYLKKAIKK